ncbi:uncharacterized protein B0P05DRAFT_554473 [Gilbertella persicaria]|uniref:uncharacterized protein n=1 Tax=Gilbertella persicaria TaxID=101096 RepID=UPI00221F6DE7|nr:uncharacterized protein B0P05DRAFT_554473 [Gilbertella persicaria]KAI8064816.1 hypothetical protein B0P05DRAFT_554473 [Gilbertella persicaria]
MLESLTVTSPTVETVLVCASCREEGHNRNTHYACPMNRAVIHNDQHSSNMTQIDIGRYFIDHLDVECSSCAALMWIDEKKSNSSLLHPKLRTCCADGKTLLKPIKPSGGKRRYREAQEEAS